MRNISILLPVLNEKIRLENGVTKTVKFMEKYYKAEYEIIIVDNGSTDETPQIAKKLVQKYKNVYYIHTKEKGVGRALRAGIKKSQYEVVGYMDIDLSTDIRHILQVGEMFEDNSIDMINGSRLNKKSKMTGRKWYRNITSYGLTFILKMMLGLKASDSICGFKFYKKSSIQKIMCQSGNENGWFYVIELLIRSEKAEQNIIELPVRWQDDPNTTVKIFKLIKNYMLSILKLRKRLKIEGLL